MHSAELKTFDLPEIRPAEARLILAVVLSLALHLALLFLVQVRPVPRPEPTRVLQVALEGRSLAARQMAEAPAKAEPQVTDGTPEKSIPVAVSPSPGIDLGKPAAPLPDPVPPSPALQPSVLPTLDVALVDDPTYYTAKQLDIHPQAAQPVRPEFPDTAADVGAEGYVTLKLLIDDGGKVREVSVVDAQPPGAFEESALAAFRAARFLPGQRNGRSVKSQILIKVTYELVNRQKKED